MNRFEKHFRMNEEDCIEYIQEKMPEYFTGDLSCKEIGDGNINYVFRVSDGTRSLIVKHADLYTRSGHTPNSLDRSALEYETLSLEKTYCPDCVPELYLFDPVMCCTIMEDLGDHENLRYALLKRETYPKLAKDMASFCARTLISTSSAILPADEKRKLEKRYTNPVMCEITDRLVFNEAFTNSLGRNIITPGNEDYVKEEIYQDEELCYEAALLKEGFQSDRQCLIHGDLHSGSIFLTKEDTKVLDPEFAIMGPAGYDLGNVAAHLIFAYVNCLYTEKDEEKKEIFTKWTKESLRTFFEDFEKEAEAILKTSTDPLYKSEKYRKDLLRRILEDAFGYTGSELIRRIVGTAKVKDLEIPEGRREAERDLIKIAKSLIKNRRDMDVSSFLSIL